jgi:molecular chaperone DnaK (HSP70)
MVYTQYDSVKYWGYQVNNQQKILPPDRLLENWKIFLDQQMINEARQAEVEDVPRSLQEAQDMVAAYLEQIYYHIKESIQAEIGRGWEEKTISFVFSLPTTWTSVATVERFKAAIAKAGFGVENPAKHTAELDLTEAEAAAVFTLKEAQVKYNVGDILLVCDAGGGTTDLGLFQVRQTVNPLSLVQIHQVQGVGIGSTMIDNSFMALVRARLQKAPDAAYYLPRYLPKMLADDIAFRTAKHSFGSRLGNHAEYYIPTVAREDVIPASFSDARLGIAEGRMKFTRHA